MCSLINKRLLLTAYAYLFIMEQQKAQQGSEALQVQGKTRTTVDQKGTQYHLFCHKCVKNKVKESPPTDRQWRCDGSSDLRGCVQGCPPKIQKTKDHVLCSATVNWTLYHCKNKRCHVDYCEGCYTRSSVDDLLERFDAESGGGESPFEDLIKEAKKKIADFVRDLSFYRNEKVVNSNSNGHDLLILYLLDSKEALNDGITRAQHLVKLNKKWKSYQTTPRHDLPRDYPEKEELGKKIEFMQETIRQIKQLKPIVAQERMIAEKKVTNLLSELEGASEQPERTRLINKAEDLLEQFRKDGKNDIVKRWDLIWNLTKGIEAARASAKVAVAEPTTKIQQIVMATSLSDSEGRKSKLQKLKQKFVPAIMTEDQFIVAQIGDLLRKHEELRKTQGTGPEKLKKLAKTKGAALHAIEIGTMTREAFNKAVKEAQALATIRQVVMKEDSLNEDECAKRLQTLENRYVTEWMILTQQEFVRAHFEAVKEKFDTDKKMISVTDEKKKGRLADLRPTFIAKLKKLESAAEKIEDCTLYGEIRAAKAVAKEEAEKESALCAY